MSDVCICERDDDGVCQKCRQSSFKFAAEFAKLIKEIQDEYDRRCEELVKFKGSCGRCEAELADNTFAQILKSYGWASRKVQMAMYAAVAALVEEETGSKVHPLIDRQIKQMTSVAGPPEPE